MKHETGKKVGIGEGGKTLAQMLNDSELLYQQTGHYWGLQDLDQWVEDPLRMELFHSRLLAAVGAAREVTRMVSASAFVREAGELCIGFFTPEGDFFIQSRGIGGHASVMGDLIKWMIRQNYEDEVGIRDGDMFCSNEVDIAAIHPQDIYDILPIFYKNELIGWAGTVIHEMEIGAVVPGGMPTAQAERFTDGIRICAEKVGEKNELRKDFERSLKFRLRLGDQFLLDRKGAIAGNFRVRDEITKTIEEFGLAYFRRGIRELIERERRDQLARARMRTVPGRYRNLLMSEFMLSHLPVAPIHRKDRYTLVPIEFTIESSGKYVLNFDGAGSWGWHPGNVTPTAIRSALGIAMIDCIAYSGKANQGTYLATEVKVPYDTVLWPSNKFLPYGSAWSILLNGYGLWLGMHSRALFSRGFREEAFAGGGSGNGMQDMAGMDHYGREPFTGIFALNGAGSAGGFAIRDAVDCAFNLYNGESDMGNIEVWEMLCPVITTGARTWTDSGGCGKYRGACTQSNTLVIYKTPRVIAGDLGMQPQSKILLNSSLYGGYPAGMSLCLVASGANTMELIRNKKPLVHEVGDPRRPDIETLVAGKHSRYPAGFGLTEDVLAEGDIVQNANSTHSGGYGDPIERDPRAVKKDLDNNYCSQMIAKNVYGIVAVYDAKEEEYVVDDAATHELRQRIRRERLTKMSVKDWWVKRKASLVRREIQPLLKAMYNDSLQKGKEWSKEFRAFWELPEDFTF